MYAFGRLGVLISKACKRFTSSHQLFTQSSILILLGMLKQADMMKTAYRGISRLRLSESCRKHSCITRSMTYIITCSITQQTSGHVFVRYRYSFILHSKGLASQKANPSYPFLKLPSYSTIKNIRNAHAMQRPGYYDNKRKKRQAKIIQVSPYPVSHVQAMQLYMQLPSHTLFEAKVLLSRRNVDRRPPASSGRSSGSTPRGDSALAKEAMLLAVAPGVVGPQVTSA